MVNVIKREIKSNFKSLIIWGIVIIVFNIMFFIEYGSIAKSAENASYYDMMPNIVKVMMGFSKLPLASEGGYYACMFFWSSLIMYIFATLKGSDILMKEEKDKTADFLYTKPIKRSTVLTAKILVAIINIAVLVVLNLLVIKIAYIPQIENKGLINDINITMIGLFVSSIIYLMAGIFLGTAIKNINKAQIYSVVFFLITYLGVIIIDMLEKEKLYFLSPFKYFNAVDILEKGIELKYILLSVGLIIALAIASYIKQEKRNITN